MVHHQHVVKQRIRARQHPTPSPTPTAETRASSAGRHTDPGQAQSGRGEAPRTDPAGRRAVAHGSPQVQLGPSLSRSARVRHRAATPVLRRAAPAASCPTERPVGRALPVPPCSVPAVRPHAAATPAAARDAPAIVTVPRHVAQYVQHQFDSMLPAVQIGFGVICVVGLFMMGYAVAMGRRRPTA